MTDFQLPLPFDAHEVTIYMLEHFGVNPCEQYCSVTGRPYGFLDIREREDTIRFLDNDDLESFCDDLFVRMIAGMRPRSEEHTSELQSLMRISYAVFCLKKKQRKEHRR